ncbi:MAG: hypothetical protein WCK82_08020 [Bacteroidota bacterium]
MKEQERVQAVINEYGDTVIQMSLLDAKLILKVVLEKEVNDSLLDVYTVVDSLNKNKISLLFQKIEVFQIEKQNLNEMVVNLNAIIENKETETQILNETIKKQKKEIRKQKIIKIVALVGDVVLPVTTLLTVMFVK